jgi:hypothetical protein
VSIEHGQWVTEWQLGIWEFGGFLKGTAGMTGFLIIVQSPDGQNLAWIGLRLIHLYYGIITAGGSECLRRGPECGVGNWGGTLLLGIMCWVYWADVVLVSFGWYFGWSYNWNCFVTLGRCFVTLGRGALEELFIYIRFIHFQLIQSLLYCSFNSMTLLVKIHYLTNSAEECDQFSRYI